MSNNKNELKVIKTGDNSPSVYNAILDETYHSSFGALTESMHVFIENGFNLFDGDKINVLEVGLGTGLNAALTLQESFIRNIHTNYIALEPYPLQQLILNEVFEGYDTNLKSSLQLIHNSSWEFPNQISEWFSFTRHLTRLQTFNSLKNKKFDLIYFDAFAPNKQPEMWTLEIFQKLFILLNPSGMLTTYCAKGQVKRNMKEAGFTIKSVKGPPGKREMTLGFKSGLRLI